MMNRKRPCRLVPKVAALILLFVCTKSVLAQTNFVPEFTIIQMNDVYRIDAVENGNAGGMGRVATLLREAGTPVFLLHAGDFIAPSLESQYFQGLQMIEAMNFFHTLAPMYVVPGNHEFDERKPDMFLSCVRASKFNWLVANLNLQVDDAKATARFSNAAVVEMGKMRVGIFGMTIHGAQNGTDRNYAPVDSNYVTISEREIRELEKKGVEVIIALTHLNVRDDRRVVQLRRQHPKFMWIAGGHEHYAQQDELARNSAMITKGDSNARSIWRVEFGRESGKVAMKAEKIQVGRELETDSNYEQSIAQRFRRELEEKVPFLNTQIGAAKVTLDGTEETVRTAESNWGSFLADLMRSAYGDLRADIAILNGGAIRIDDKFSGEIRFEHLFRTFGFPTRVAYVWLSGKDVKSKLLEHSVSGDLGEGRFLQVSGIKFEYDRSRPVGDRIGSVKVQQGQDWNDLEGERIHIVAVPDYLYYGGDGYQFKASAVMSLPPGPELKLMAFDAISKAFAKGDSLAPKVEGRIVRIGS